MSPDHDDPIGEPALPILAEIGDELYRANKAGERTRHRRMATATVLAAVAITGVVLGVHPDFGHQGPEPTAPRGQTLLTGHTNTTTWQLIVYRLGGRRCLDVLVQTRPARGKCDALDQSAPAAITAVHFNEDMRGFVYGIAGADTRHVAVRLDDGRCSSAQTAVTTLDTGRSPVRVHAYVATFDRPITLIKPARPVHGHNPDTLVRVPKTTTRRFPGGSASVGTCSASQ